MSEVKHTPEPWKTHKQARTIAIFRASNADTIASVPISQVVDNLRRDADARLIAAAPELLEALQGMLNYFGDLPENIDFPAEIDKARAAIAKATGA